MALDRLDLPRPVSFIKADIEGAEPLAFRGADALLRADRPVILSELHPLQLERVSGVTPAQFIAEMRARGYRCHLLGAGVAGEEIDDAPSNGVTSVVFLPMLDDGRQPQSHGDTETAQSIFLGTVRREDEPCKISVRPLCLCVSVVDVRDIAQARSSGRSGVDPLATAWPRHRRPRRWPATLTKKWKVSVGSGYATPIVADGRVFVHARTGEHETITAFDAATGKPIWTDPMPAPYKVNPAAASHGPGPKSSPVLANGRLYTFGISGILVLPRRAPAAR